MVGGSPCGEVGGAEPDNKNTKNAKDYGVAEEIVRGSEHCNLALCAGHSLLHDACLDTVKFFFVFQFKKICDQFFFSEWRLADSITSMPTAINNREEERTEPLVRTDTGMEAEGVADDGTENDTETPTVLVSEVNEVTESTQPPTPELEAVQTSEDVRVFFGDAEMVEVVEALQNDEDGSGSCARRVRGAILCIALSGMTVVLATSGFFWWTPLYRY